MATKIARRVLAIGLFAGTLDIPDALIFNVLRGITPEMLLQYIASGLIGAASFHGGLVSTGLGLVLHYLIALGWTILFYIASREIAILTRRPILSGLIYGDVIYLVMNFVILPVSNVSRPKSTTTIAALVNGVLAVMLCIGLPVSVLTSRYQPTRDRG
jgi:hypothetical protein